MAMYVDGKGENENASWGRKLDVIWKFEGRQSQLRIFEKRILPAYPPMSIIS